MQRTKAMRAVVIVLAALVVAACTREQTTPAQDELVFRVRVANLGIQTGALADGRSPDEEVELRLPGELFDPPLEASVISREESDRSSPVPASASAFSASKADDADWILSNFAQQDRDDVQVMLANEEMRARNRDALSRYDSYKIYGRARYVSDAPYELLFIRYGDASNPGLVEAFVQEDGEWKRTNALSADEQFDIAWAAFNAGSITDGR